MTRKRGFAAIIVMILTASTVHAQFAPVVTSSPPTSIQSGEAYIHEVKAPALPAPTYALEPRPQGKTIENEKEKPVITSTPITQATVNVEYEYKVKASGKPKPKYSLSSAPAGMTVHLSSGKINWTPAAAGEYPVSVTAINSNGSDTQDFTILVPALYQAPNIISDPVTAATAGQNYVYDIEATGNPTPTFVLLDVPEGMQIDNDLGLITWTPLSTGNFSVTAVAKNEAGEDAQPYTIAVSAQLTAPTISSTPVIEATVNEQYQYVLTAEGVPNPTLSLLNAPAGMTINATSGLIEWLPSAAGGYQIMVAATNSQGADTQAFTLTINEQLFEPIITSIPPAQALINQTFKYTVSAVANPAATYALVTAPANMSINSTTGDILWMPTQAGVHDISVQASNSLGSVIQDFSLAVSMESAAPTILSTPITLALLGIDYTYHVEAAGHPLPLYSLTEHPPGMTIDASTGIISWMPASPGNYSITVGAENSEGRIEQQFIVRVGIPGSVPLVQLHSVKLINPNVASLTAIANPSGISTQVSFEYGINQVDEFQVSASPGVIEGFSDQTVAARLEGLVGGATYKYRAVAENQIGRVVSAVQSFTAYQSSYQIAVDRPFSGSIDSLGYRLFSVPGDIDLDASETLEGLQAQDWGIFADNGQPENYFQAYDGSEAFRFKPGRGFWILSRTNWMVSEQSVNTVQLDPNGVFQLTLQPGWNIIASPFIESVPWTLVRDISPSASPTAKLWAFNGSFYEANSLEAYHAYNYFNGGEPGGTLSIPYPGLWPDTSMVSASKSPEAPRVAPFLTLEATGFDSLRSSIEFLIDGRAKAASDQLDQYAPRNGFSRLSLRIDPEFQAPYVFLALDARPSIEEGARYDIVLDAIAGQRVELQTKNLEKFNNMQVFFVDGTTGEFTDLHEQDRMVIYPDKNRTRHHVVAGPPAFVDEQRVELVLETILLQQNYPNPFSGATTISYSLPEAGYIDLTVYDVLGREVAQLAGGIQLAGFHEVAWDGTTSTGAHLPNGVYFLRLSTEKGAYRVVSMTKVK